MFGNRARKKKENSQPVRVSLTFSFFGDLWDNFATKEKETVGRREDEERETSTSFLSFFFWYFFVEIWYILTDFVPS